MKYGDKVTFWYLLNNYEIQVPEIQRDYVQGRETDIIKRNKDDLIKKMVSAVVNNKVVDLNFTYGMKHNNFFIPIDGQQRLTTLFLFHFYLSIQTKYIAEDKEYYKKFTYKTRRTSDKFLTLLLNNCEDLSKLQEKEKVASNIENSNWFLNSFKHDLTIVSMLSVLKQIQDEFGNLSNWDHYYKNLFEFNNSRCPITFMFIALEDFDDDNELYVKMNSRGKQLTNFENFKSDLYDFIDNPIKAETPKEIKERNDLKAILDIRLIEEFKKSIDGSWLDVFWSNSSISTKYSVVEDRALYIDSLFKNLFHYMFVNQLVSNGLCDDDKSFGRKWISPKSDWNNANKIGLTFLDQYIEFNDGDTSISYRKCLMKTIKDFKYVMDYFTRNPSSINEFLYLDSDNGQIKKFNLSEYKERTYLYVLCLLGYTTLTPNDTDFTYYKRTLKHIIDNTEIDNESKFIEFIKGIQKSIDYAKDFENETLDVSGSYRFDNVFDEHICKEELLKNRLRYKGKLIWEHVIDDAEKKGNYPGSQIGFLFDFLSIIDSDYNDIAKRDKFKEYADALSDVFYYKVENDKGNLLHRTLLTYVMQDSNNLLSLFAKRSNGIYSFCSNKNDDFAHRNNDWRGQLIINDYFKNTFKKMYDDFVAYKKTNPKANTFKNFADEKIRCFKEEYTDINKYLISIIVKFDWKLPFKNNEHKYYFANDNNSFAFLKTTQRHEIFDIHLYYLQKLLDNKGFNWVNKIKDNKWIIEAGKRNKKILIDYDLNLQKFIVEENAAISDSDANNFIDKLKNNNLI